jgi:predicted O-methyltransferase YrrM
MWGSGDLMGFEMESKNNTGQIKSKDNISRIIRDLCSNKENKNLVEIGTWNGLGSTRFFIEAMLNNSDSVFYSLENNLDKYNFAKDYWQKFVSENNLNVNFLHGSLISVEELDDYIKNSNMDLSPGQIEWLDIDKANTTNIIELPIQKIDVLLIDGGEFNGYLEFQKLGEISKYVILDDINSYKNMENHENLLKNSEFELIYVDKSERNGVSVFKNLSL